MKNKFKLFALTFLFSVTAVVTNAALVSSAQPSEANNTATAEQKEARLTEIKKRVEEIKAMDKSQLSRAERKYIRQELRDMKKQAREITGIYLSVGAIIIIILLLILIL